MAEIVLEHVNKIYHKVHAIKDFNLTIADRELMVFVGPSGCGKSTILRMIAGLETVSSGVLKIDGQVVNDIAPKDRDMAMVFQNYALYPHLSVYENMAFGLKMRKCSRHEIDQRVHEAARILQIELLLGRKPRELSGGQQQRVAMGRAIVREPKVFLMDEPLSNLDAKLRTEMRSRIGQLHRRLGATMIYVTHDQVEAMTLGDRIVVMRDGQIMQLGTPLDLYEFPENRFVAEFIGSLSMNFLRATVQGGRCVIGAHAIQPQGQLAQALPLYEGRVIDLGIRPEHLGLVGYGDMPEDNALPGRVVVVEALGAQTDIMAEVGGQQITAKLAGRVEVRPGDQVQLLLRPDRLHAFDIDTERALG